MPVKHVGLFKQTKYPTLVSRLVEELRKDEDAPPLEGAPFIIEEQVHSKPLFHVLVIWDAWKGIPIEDRGGVVMDAYQEFDNTRVPNISLAMALTAEEAEKLQIGPEQYALREDFSRGLRILGTLAPQFAGPIRAVRTERQAFDLLVTAKEHLEPELQPRIDRELNKLKQLPGFDPEAA